MGDRDEEPPGGPHTLGEPHHGDRYSSMGSSIQTPTREDRKNQKGMMTPTREEKWVRHYDEESGYYYFAKVTWEKPEEGWVDHKDLHGDDSVVMAPLGTGTPLRHPLQRQEGPPYRESGCPLWTNLLIVALCIVATVTVGLLLINTYRLYEIERHFEDGATSFTPNWSIFSTKDDHNHPKIPTPGNVPPKMPPKGHDPRRRSNNRVTKSPSTKKPRSAIRRMFDSLNGAIRNHPIKVCGVAATAVYCAQTMGYLQPEGAQLPKQKGGASLRTQGPSPVETFVKALAAALDQIRF